MKGNENGMQFIFKQVSCRKMYFLVAFFAVSVILSFKITLPTKDGKWELKVVLGTYVTSKI